MNPHPPSNYSTSFMSFSPCASTKISPSPTPQPTWPLNSLELQICWGLGTSSLTEPRLSSPLLYMSWGSQISRFMLPGWWSSVWEILEGQVNWDCLSSYRVAFLLSFFQLFPISSTGGSCFSPLFGCNICIWLFQLLVRFFGGECSIPSVIVSGLGTSPWAKTHIGPVADPSFHQAPLHFHPGNSFKHEQLWVRIVTVGWQPHPSLDVHF